MKTLSLCRVPEGTRKGSKQVSDEIQKRKNHAFICREKKVKASGHVGAVKGVVKSASYKNKCAKRRRCIIMNICWRCLYNPLYSLYCMYVADGGTCVITWRKICPAQYHECHCRDCRLTDNDDLFLLAFSACHLEGRGKRASRICVRACQSSLRWWNESNPHTHKEIRKKKRESMCFLFSFLYESPVF